MRLKGKQQSDIDVKKKVHNLNILTTRDKTSYELANFLHVCVGSPTIRTFQQAIKNNFFATWPGIHKLNMKYRITDHTNIAMGHLDQDQKIQDQPNLLRIPKFGPTMSLQKLFSSQPRRCLMGTSPVHFPTHLVEATNTFM